MKSFYLKLLSFIVAAASCLAVALVLSRPANSVVVANDDKPSSDLIAGYKTWTRVNSDPQVVSARMSAACAIPPEQLKMDAENPHFRKLIVVYVNNSGRQAMMEQKNPIFPHGSIIVKEKLTTKDSKTPELLTVMRKREPGYDAGRGDWEYIVFDGPGKVVQASGKLEKCQACHLLEKNTDYVSRNYLPSDVWNKLK